MPDLIFHPDISLEVKESYQWYQHQARGLGDDFLHELEGAYDVWGQSKNSLNTN